MFSQQQNLLTTSDFIVVAKNILREVLPSILDVVNKFIHAFDEGDEKAFVLIKKAGTEKHNLEKTIALFNHLANKKNISTDEKVFLKVYSLTLKEKLSLIIQKLLEKISTDNPEPVLPFQFGNNFYFKDHPWLIPTLIKRGAKKSIEAILVYFPEEIDYNSAFRDAQQYNRTELAALFLPKITEADLSLMPFVQSLAPYLETVFQAINMNIGNKFLTLLISDYANPFYVSLYRGHFFQARNENNEEEVVVACPMHPPKEKPQPPNCWCTIS